MEKVTIFLLGTLLLYSTCMAVIGLDGGSLSGACVGVGGCACVSAVSEATAPRCSGGRGWMASEYKVQEKCAHHAAGE